MSMRSLAAGLSAGLALLFVCGSNGEAQTSKSGKAAAKPVATINVGFNSALDQIAVPVGVELGFFEDRGLEAKLAPAFASGVEALNALQAGNVDFVHVGAPLQGAMISGIDVVY